MSRQLIFTLTYKTSTKTWCSDSLLPSSEELCNIEKQQEVTGPTACPDFRDFNKGLHHEWYLLPALNDITGTVTWQDWLLFNHRSNLGISGHAVSRWNVIESEISPWNNKVYSKKSVLYIVTVDCHIKT